MYRINNISVYYMLLLLDYFCRPLRVSTNLRRFPNQDLSPAADTGMQQPDWGRDSKPGHHYPPANARMADYEYDRDRPYPDSVVDPRVHTGYIVEGYPEEVVMRKKPDDRPYYQYHPQRNGFENRPERVHTRQPEEYVPGGQSPTRAVRSPVSGKPQDLYAKVVRPSERDQNAMPRQPYNVDPVWPSYDRGPDVSMSSSASFSHRPDGGRVDDRWRPSPSPADVIQQRNLQPARDHNHNINKYGCND